ncbi:MAG: HEAT repeat domain-containing protein [Vicinamibacterales bacterium]
MNTNRILTLACALTLTAGLAVAPAAAQTAAPASLDAILAQVASYDGGIASDALWKLRDYVYARRDSAAGRAECEGKLLQFLKGTATPPAKWAAARLLRVIAGDTAVPGLQGMLPDPRLSDYAIYVLQPMTGAAAEAALVQSLKTARGGQKAAVVAALGQRRAASTLPLLEPMLRDPALATTAATAIGRIGGPASAASLLSAFGAASGESKQLMAASVLEAAAGLLESKEPEAANGLFGALAADRSLPVPLRRAALMGSITAAGPRAANLLVSMLGDSDAESREAAIARLTDVVPQDGIGPVCDLLPRLPAEAQVQVLAALSGYPVARVQPAVLEAARSDSPEVRVAALKALELAGDASTVPFLAGTAASAQKGPVQDAARRALGGLRGLDIDDAIVGALAQPSSDAVAVELLKAASDRRIFQAKPAVSASLSAASAAVRIEALKTLRVIGTPSDASPVLDLLVKTGDDLERGEAEKTVTALLLKMGHAEGRSRLVRTRLAAEKEAATRAALIPLLPPTADGAALPVLRAALEDADAGVVDAAARAIAAWPAATARDDMLKLVKTAKDETHRLLAFAGLVRLAGLDVNRLPEAAVADLGMLSGLAWRPEEQKLVLGALAAFPCQDALALARGFLQNEALKAEAQAAIDKITPKLPKDAKR